MNARPMLFSAPMVRALLDGSKTQTRRLAKVNADGCKPGVITPNAGFTPRRIEDHATYCPYGLPGDLIWVREMFSGPHCAEASDGCAAVPPSKWGRSSRIWFWADGNPQDGDWTRPRPSIHMPRWASRLTLRITDVRVQRLQEISAEDAIAEGVEGAFVEDGRYWRNYGLSDEDAACSPMLVSPIHSFKSLWESIYGPESWHDDPFVWALTFEAIKANVDAVIAGAAP